MSDRIIICIPLKLKNRQEITAALFDKYGRDYLLDGRIFRSTVEDESCQIDINVRTIETKPDRQFPGNNPQPRLHDNCAIGSNLASTFQIAGQNKISQSLLQQIDNCQQVIYLTSLDTGYNACLKIARLVKVILDIGGIAVKVESAGIAHDRDRWQADYNSKDPFDIYSLFVILVEGDDFYYSCGMHNFGKADVGIEVEEDIGLAIYVMNVFNYYRLTESPILQDNHTFRPDIQSPRYRLKWTTDNEVSISSPLYNTYGRWLLFRS